MDTLVEALVPGMPVRSGRRSPPRREGIPLSRWKPCGRLSTGTSSGRSGGLPPTGEVGQLQVPDSLHALLAAAWTPGPGRTTAGGRRRGAGATFPAEALIAVSGQDEAVVRAALADLVRREAPSVSADPLSPERGSYGFAQNMLRQVAYDTLSRRDRKARHLAVAAYSRAAFPGDGEEVAEVIARHYLDALDAMPDDRDAGQIRGQAIAALTRAADRAWPHRGSRPGSPPATPPPPGSTQAGPADGGKPPPRWRGNTPPRPPGPVPTGRGRSSRPARPRILYRQCGDARSAARAQVIAGQALRLWGRHAQAREQLTVAVAVLRDAPGADTVRALGELAGLEVFSGSPRADALSAEALSWARTWPSMRPSWPVRALTPRDRHAFAGRRPEAAATSRQPPGWQGRRYRPARRALLNLFDAVTSTDPAAGAEAARAAAAQLRQTGRCRQPRDRGHEPGPGAADDRRLGHRPG